MRATEPTLTPSRKPLAQVEARSFGTHGWLSQTKKKEGRKIPRVAVAAPGYAPEERLVTLDRAVYLRDVDLGLVQLLQKFFRRQRQEVGAADEALSAVQLNLQVSAPGTVRIRNCGDAMCGTIARVSTRGGAEANPRNRVGVPVLMGMRLSGPNKWTGRLYNVDDGKTYTGNLIEVGPDTIRIEGCALFICGGENLTRVKSTASAH